MRGIKIRLYPNKGQTQDLNKILGCYRFVYNHMLCLKQQAYDETKANLKLTDLSYHFHNELLKNPDYSWLAEQNTKIMKQSIRQMLVAYNNFFHHRARFPKFKSKKDRQSALFPLEAISKRNTFDTRNITLTSNLKNIKFRCSDLYYSRLKEYKDTIRSATLSKTKGGNWFLSILMDIPESEYINKHKHTGKHVGIDLGVKDFIVTSDGEVFENRHFRKKTESRIKRLQRQLSRKQKGSRNREKARLKLARVYDRIGRQKEAYLYETVHRLLEEYDIMFIEDLNVEGMVRNHKLAKSISEMGFGRFADLLEYKASLDWKQVIKVDRWYASSKTCSGCGYVYKGLTLGERSWKCPECGEVHDRDYNAAVNILREGERIIGSRRPEYKPVENPTVDDRQQAGLRSGGSVKQEVKT